MFSQRLPQLHRGELKRSVSKGSGDPRRDSSSSMKLSLEQSTKPTNSCRAIHALWNQDVKEVTLRMYRVESSLRMSQGEATRLNEQHEDDMHRLRAKVYVLEEEVHLLQNELQSQRHEHHDLTQELRTEMHRTRELMHQMTGDIQGLKDDQNPGLAETSNESDESDAASSPATPEAMTNWGSKKSDGQST